MEYKFKFTLDKKQYTKAKKESKYAKGKIARARVGINGVSAIVFLSIVCLEFLFVSSFNITISCAAFLLFILALFGFSKVLNYEEINKLRENKYLDSVQQVIINDEGIISEIAYYKLKFNWEFIKKAVMMSEYVFVFTIEYKFIIISKAAFNNIDQMQEVCKFVDKNIAAVTIKKKIQEYIKKLGGNLENCEKAENEIGPFTESIVGKDIYKFTYVIGDQAKQGWVRFGNPYGPDWRV